MTGFNAVNASALAREEGVQKSALHLWLNSAAKLSRVATTGTTTAPASKNPKRPQNWTAAEKANLLDEAAAYSDDELVVLRHRSCQL
ncbi:MAG: hypothetical protein V3V08_03695 [Nannocystaceae bacterium]